MSNSNLHFETLQIHAGHQPDSETHSRAVPIYQTASYVFENSKHGADLFGLKVFGDIYSRISSPTANIFEQRIAALEGGIGALSTASGHAAQLITFISLLNPGDNIISSPYLYGGTFNQFNVLFRRYGIDVRFADSLEADDFEKLIDENTKAIYFETIGNPGFVVPDFEKLAALANKYDLLEVVDNTFAGGGYLAQPLKLGAHIVVESATKWIGGHGTTIGGVIIDGGTYDWGNGKFPEITEPSDSYHGLKFLETFGELAFLVKARAEILRDVGAPLSPFNAFLLIQGLETLSLRLERHVENAQKLAEYLDKHPKVKSVNYPGLESSPSFALAKKYLPKGAGSVLSFELEGTLEQATTFVDNLKLISNLANVGDAKSLIIQPAATTHQQLPEEAQRKAGVTPTQLRLSVGIEHFDDIVADIEQALSLI